MNSLGHSTSFHHIPFLDQFPLIGLPGLAHESVRQSK